jgi:1-pyrroline-5-carboxylate dehydrogenase
MGIFRDFAQHNYVRPIILELGGKNPAIVSRHADLERAAIGIVRSAFGLQGQKCSACSRVYIEEPLSTMSWFQLVGPDQQAGYR